MERLKPALAGAGMLVLSAALTWLFLQLLVNEMLSNFFLGISAVFILLMPSFYFFVRGIVVFFHTSNLQWRRDSAEITTNLIEGLGKLSFLIIALFILAVPILYFWDSLTEFASPKDIIVISLLALILLIALFILDCALKILALLRSRAN